MSENIIQECETRLNSLQRGIETATGESYNDLTEAVKGVLDGYGQGGAVDEVGEFLKQNLRGLNFEQNDTFTETPLIDCINITWLQTAFNNCRAKTIRLKNTQNVTTWINAFYNCRDVETIETLDFSGAQNVKLDGAFYNCIKLQRLKVVSETITQNVYFEYCSKLTAESVQNIVNGLAYITSVKTVTFHKNIVLTDEQKATISNKGWTLVQK